MKIEIGSISSGTLRLKDLIPAFVEELSLLSNRLSFEDKKEASRLRELQSEIEQRADEQLAYHESEQAAWDLDTLTEELTLLAPPYCYFGTLEGDGADFGFWISEEGIAEARYEKTLPSGDELPELAVGEFLVISDHGNMELYAADTDGAWVSVWSVV